MANIVLYQTETCSISTCFSNTSTAVIQISLLQVQLRLCGRKQAMKQKRWLSSFYDFAAHISFKTPGDEDSLWFYRLFKEPKSLIALSMDVAHTI